MQRLPFHGINDEQEVIFKNIMELSEETIDAATREYLGRLGTGAVLLARDVLQDPNFIATMVLLCIYSKEGGTYGLVLNRPSHMPLSEMFDGFSEMNEPRKVYIGGPVQQEELQIIQITDDPVADSHQLSPRVYLGGKWEDVDQMLMLDADSTRLFLGYSGWAAGQLEGEIAAGAWDVFDKLDLEKLLQNIDRTVGSGVKQIAQYLETLRAS
jgi:putative transcriptional regulator